MCGKNHTHDSSGSHWQFLHMFGFYHTHGSSGNQCFLSSKFSGRPSEGSFENVLWRKVKQMQPMWLCLLTFGNTQCRKIKQMQPMWRCNMHPLWQAISGLLNQETFETTQWRKVKQMQPMWLRIFSGRQFEDTYATPKSRKIEKMTPSFFVKCRVISKFWRLERVGRGRESQKSSVGSQKYRTVTHFVTIFMFCIFCEKKLNCSHQNW